MSHGLPAHYATLYDKDGNPFHVELVDGQYRLVTNDVETHNKLDEIILQLAQLVERLEVLHG